MCICVSLYVDGCVGMCMRVCEYVCVCVFVCEYMYRSEDNLLELVPHFHHVGFGDPTLLPSRGFVLVCFLY